MNSVIGLEGRYSSGFAPSNTPAWGATRLPVGVGLAEDVTADSVMAATTEEAVEAILPTQPCVRGDEQV